MSGFAYDFSGYRWIETKKAFVNLCVNDHSEPLFDGMRGIDAGECVDRLSPVLGQWIDDHVFPAVMRKISSTEQPQDRDNWSTGLALFTFSPARRTGEPKDKRDPDRMTRYICASEAQFRRCFMRRDDACARAMLGTCLGHHFSDTKDRLVLVELRELSIRTWWKIERARREVLEEWHEAVASDDLTARRLAKEGLASEEAQAKETLRRLPNKLGVTQWERVQLYVDVFGTSSADLLDIADFYDIEDDPTAGDEFLRQLQDCLDAGDSPNALGEDERQAILREYIHDIPKGLNHGEFVAAYGISRPTHRKRVQSGLVKLGHCLGHLFGESR